MSVTIDGTGVHIALQADIREEIIVAMQAALALTNKQTQRLRDTVLGSLNQIVRIEAERESVLQESLLAVYNTLSLETEGVPLERVVALLGVVRRAAFASVVAVTLTGTPATLIPAGTRVQYVPKGSIWATDAAYTIGAGGTVAANVVSEALDAETVGSPLSADWAILDIVIGFAALVTISQTTIGAALETDPQLRQRASVEAFRRGSGPQAAIRAAVTQVVGVTYVGVWESQALLASDTDADGIPARSINVVVQGGDDAAVAAAIEGSRAAGIRIFGAPGATLVTTVITKSNGSNVTAGFNRVENIPLWIQCTITTSTSEDAAPADVTSLVAARLLAQAPVLFEIGEDVLPWKLEGDVNEAAIPGIDDVQVALSFDNGGTDPFTRAKRTIALRQLATFDAVRITVTEV